MMKRLTILLLAAAFFCGSAVAQKKRVAIIDFEFGTVKKWWDGNWDIGKGISDMLVDELVNDGTYSIIERRQLDAILAEQNFSNSDRADARSAAKVGKILGVSAIVVGSITQFGVEKKGFNLGGAAGRLGGFGRGNVGTQKGKAKVAITARIIDVNTAEILASTKGDGKSSRSGLILGGAGGSGGGFGAGGLSMTSSDFRETILGEATEAAVTKLASKLVDYDDRIKATKVEIKGLIAHVDGTMVVVNVGSESGLSTGAVLNVMRVTNTIKDPATGKVLREMTKSLGKVRVDEVDAGSSVGTLIEGADAGVKVGDLVRSQK